MPRKPTGNPPGRPPAAVAALKKDKAKQKAMREALAFFKDMDVHLTEVQKDRLRRNSRASAKDAASWVDVPFPAHALVPFTELQPLSAEELSQVSDRTKGLLGAIVAGFSAKVPDLMSRLASESPEKALRVWMDMQEFVMPKLARTENHSTIDQRAAFVAVEARETDPRPRVALPGPTNNISEPATEAEFVEQGHNGDTREQGPEPAPQADSDAPGNQG